MKAMRAIQIMQLKGFLRTGMRDSASLPYYWLYTSLMVFIMTLSLVLNISMAV